jgi:uncharacterized phiE125 gp8 family phage protein
MISIVAAGAPVVTLDEAKAHIRATSSSDDVQITGFVAAATAYVADEAGILLGAGTFEMVLDAWCSEIAIPAKPVRDIVSVRYLDVAGVEQTVDAANYYTLSSDEGATLYLLSTFARPALRAERKDAVRVRFQGGYAAGDESPNFALPPHARIAILMLAAAYYDNRDAVDPIDLKEMPFGVGKMIAKLRVYR